MFKETMPGTSMSMMLQTGKSMKKQLQHNLRMQLILFLHILGQWQIQMHQLIQQNLKMSSKNANLKQWLNSRLLDLLIKREKL